jgi:antitoxin HigA-1
MLSKNIKPDLRKLRPALFWDTTFDNIDWLQHKQFAIDRVLERGTEEEKKMIRNFYPSLDNQK